MLTHQTVYHHIIPVPRIQTGRPQNLELMNRLDLHSAFTKIALWQQTQFSKIVYVDADIVAYRAPDELFDIDAPFSAAPDIGWPDIFNTGVMILTPDLAEYDRLRAMADAGESFDGADQGLLNMHFGAGYNRISFTYNVTPSAHYQYIPAYKHFQSSINMVHFIGAQKPWFQGRPEGAPSAGNSNDGPEASPHDKMTAAWWDVYDRHYKPSEVSFECITHASSFRILGLTAALGSPIDAPARCETCTVSGQGGVRPIQGGETGRRCPSRAATASCHPGTSSWASREPW